MLWSCISSQCSIHADLLISSQQLHVLFFPAKHLLAAWHKQTNWHFSKLALCVHSWVHANIHRILPPVAAAAAAHTWLDVQLTGVTKRVTQGQWDNQTTHLYEKHTLLQSELRFWLWCLACWLYLPPFNCWSTDWILIHPWLEPLPANSGLTDKSRGPRAEMRLWKTHRVKAGFYSVCNFRG